jgi:hypothetical protein
MFQRIASLVAALALAVPAGALPRTRSYHHHAGHHGHHTRQTQQEKTARAAEKKASSNRKSHR